MCEGACFFGEVLAGFCDFLCAGVCLVGFGVYFSTLEGAFGLCFVVTNYGWGVAANFNVLASKY